MRVFALLGSTRGRVQWRFVIDRPLTWSVAVGGAEGIDEQIRWVALVVFGARLPRRVRCRAREVPEAAGQAGVDQLRHNQELEDHSQPHDRDEGSQQSVGDQAPTDRARQSQSCVQRLGEAAHHGVTGNSSECIGDVASGLAKTFGDLGPSVAASLKERLQTAPGGRGQTAQAIATEAGHAGCSARDRGR